MHLILTTCLAESAGSDANSADGADGPEVVVLAV